MLYKDELLFIIKNWRVEQVIQYINQLEARVMAEKELIRELRQVKRKMTRTPPKDTGTRGGN